MFGTTKPLGAALIVLAGLAAASPLYAHSKPKPSTGHDMMQGGGMDGMDGMMGMMEQMTKMMDLCNKMMASKMDGTGGHDMPMPQSTPETPKQGG